MGFQRTQRKDAGGGIIDREWRKNEKQKWPNCDLEELFMASTTNQHAFHTHVAKSSSA